MCRRNDKSKLLSKQVGERRGGGDVCDDDEEADGGGGGLRGAPQKRRPTRRSDAQARVACPWLGRSRVRSVRRRTDQAQGGCVGRWADESRRRQEYTLVDVGGGVRIPNRRQEYTLVGGEAGGRRAATGQATSARSRSSGQGSGRRGAGNPCSRARRESSASSCSSPTHSAYPPGSATACSLHARHKSTSSACTRTWRPTARPTFSATSNGPCARFGTVGPHSQVTRTRRRTSGSATRSCTPTNSIPTRPSSVTLGSTADSGANSLFAPSPFFSSGTWDRVAELWLNATRGQGKRGGRRRGAVERVTQRRTNLRSCPY